MQRLIRVTMALIVLAATALMTVFAPSASAAALAFPGAEGYGTTTAGGRGGTICQVTNLNDSGAGSLRACATASGPRVVIFRVGGTISLQSRINVLNPNMTILGHTAPGDGITLRMAPGSNTDQGTMQIETHDIVIRYLRFRPGNPDNTADDSHDGVQIYKAGVNNVVIDHSSVSWAVDENVNTYDESDNITVSWSIISEALSDSSHPDGEHSKGMLSGGVNAHNVSIHHNLFASNVDRNPQVSGVSIADVRNNVVYNYGDGSGDGTTLISSSKGVPQVNIVNNYYRKGASSPSNYPDWALYSGDNGCVHQVYVSGNKHDESGTVTNATRGSGCTQATVANPFNAPAVTTTSAEQAYVDVLAKAGASKVRDAVDTRIVNEVTGRTGSFKNSAPAYPTLSSGTPPTDSDGDGLPDSWENSGEGTTPNGDQDGDGYTNIEEWAESLLGGGENPPPSNQAPNVNAGVDSTVTFPNAASLDGTVTDDGLPNGSNVTQTWSKVSGPGTVSFGNASAVDTSATFSEAGTYVLRLTATDGALTASDDVTVVSSTTPVNEAPLVNAGSDASVVLPDSASLDGTVSDPNNDPLTTTWSKVSGPGTVTFGNASNVDTSASFSSAGTYVLRLTADDGNLSSNDEVTITVTNQAPQNQPPVVSAGPDRNVTLPNSANLDGTVSDDGGAQNVSIAWSKFSGPGTVTFGNAAAIDTTASFSMAGTYVLIVEADDGEFETTDTVTVTVSDPEVCEPGGGGGSGVGYVTSAYEHSQTSSVSISKPSGLLDGDKIIFYVQENKGTGGTITAPSGVTALGAEEDDGSSLGGRMYVHTVASTSPSSWSFSGSAFSQMSVAIAVYRGAGLVTQRDLDDDDGTDNDHNTVGTTSADSLVLAFGSDRVYASGAVPSTWTVDTALVERLEGQGPKSGSAFSTVIADTGTVVTAGAKDYDLTANQSSPYAMSAMVQIDPLS